MDGWEVIDLRVKLKRTSRLYREEGREGACTNSRAMADHGERTTTGRFLVVLSRSNARAALAAVREYARRAQYVGGLVPADLEAREVVFFEEFDIALASLDERQRAELENHPDLIEAIEPEPVLRAVTHGSHGGSAFNETEYTWGLQATAIPKTAATGHGVRVAVLDTGIDLSHPDFAGRRIVTESFVGDGTIEDVFRHGTHCAGTVCGTNASSAPRYGVAPGAELFVGKVCEDNGRADGRNLIDGLSWALRNDCAVASVSLAQSVPPGTASPEAFERVAGVALDRGMLIVAATGNDSDRPQRVAPVGFPANTSVVLAVAAVNSHLRVAYFSNGQDGIWKAPDLAGPGVDVYSAWPTPDRYRRVSGTSMATPHVAGIAALHAEVTGRRGRELRETVLQSVLPLADAPADVGAGLVAAPP